MRQNYTATVQNMSAFSPLTALEQYDACMDMHRTGEVAQSMEMLRKMTADFPDFALAYNALAAFYKKENNLDAAIEYMEKYCALEPNDPFGFSILSAYCIAADRRAQAEEALGRAGELQFKAQLGG
jgi:predicted Zn-dependent protease